MTDLLRTAEVTLTQVTQDDLTPAPQLDIVFCVVGSLLCLALVHWLDSVHKEVADTLTVTGRMMNSRAKKYVLASQKGGAGRWVRPLGSMESMMAAAGLHGTCNTVTCLWLAASVPLVPHQVARALSTVARQTEALQLCVRRRWLRLWFREMTHKELPFSVEEGEVLTVFNMLLHHTYDMSQGPLWLARLVPLPETESGKYQAALLLSLHHAITDGVSNMVLSRDVLHSLNNVFGSNQLQLTARPLADNLPEQMFTFTHLPHMITYFVRTAYICFLKNYNKTAYFSGALPQPRTCERLTSVLHTQLSECATTQLRQRCKASNVRVHSCVVAAANIALLHLAQQRSEDSMDEAKISTINCVNTRRYLEPELKEMFGCHIAFDENKTMVRHEDGTTEEKFWALAKKLQCHLQHRLDVDKDPIRISPLFRTCTLLIDLNYELTLRGYQNRTAGHLMTTNLGDLQHLLPGSYDHGPVEVTSVLRSVSSELSGHLFQLTFHTFRGKFMLSVDYYSTKVPEDVARQFFHKLSNYLNNLAQHGTIAGKEQVCDPLPETTPSQPAGCHD